MTLLWSSVIGCPSGGPLAIDPAGPTVVLLGQTLQFIANKSVQWEVAGGSENGTIDGGGLYTAPDSLPQNTTVTINASAGAETTTGIVTLRTADQIVFDPSTLDQINQRPVNVFATILQMIVAGVSDRLAVTPDGSRVDATWLQVNDAGTPDVSEDDIGEIFFNQNLNFQGFGDERSLSNFFAGNKLSSAPTSLEIDGLLNPGILAPGAPIGSKQVLVRFIGSANGGDTFQNPIPLQPLGGIQINADLQYDGNDNAHAVFVAIGLGTSRILYGLSQDHGIQWRISDVTDGNSFRVAPSIAVDDTGNNLHICYQDTQGVVTNPTPTDPADIFYTFSDDGGQTFSAPLKITNSKAASVCHVALGTLGQVYLSFQEQGRVMLAGSIDGGLSFPNLITVNQMATNLDPPLPFMAVDNMNRIDVVWDGDPDIDGNADTLFHARSVDGGLTFSPQTPIAGGEPDILFIFPSGLRHDASGRAHLMFWVSHDAADPFHAEFDIFYLRGQ